jgi:hypothetical protein
MLGKLSRFSLLFVMVMQLFITTAFAKASAHEFMTPRDLTINDSTSNINLRNNSRTATTAYGLYIRQLSYVTPGESCENATIIYPTGSIPPNITVGAVLMPTVINPRKDAAIGKNYLYNMLFQANYYVNIQYSSSPPGCALPGCTWGADTTVYNWCIHLGALAPVSTTAGYTASVAPSTELASSPGLYDYNLVSDYVLLGPISCNDQTLTCTVATPQTQPFS